MDCTITVIKERQMAIIRSSGVAVVSEISDYQHKLTDNVDWSPGMNILVDHTGLVTTHLTFQEIQSISKSISSVAKELGDGRLALVVRTMMGYGLARMWQILTSELSSLNIKIFRSIDHAEQWVETGVM